MADNTIEYKCPSCGGRLEFDSASQMLKCPYCDSSFTVESFSSGSAPSGNCWATDEGFAVYNCSSCGAELIADETAAAMHCPYCDNPIILKDRLSGQLKPDYIIPFKLDKESAKAALREHLCGKKLLPKVFSNENHLDEVKGIYVPFWLYDATADASASYSMEKVRMWSDMHYNYTETRHFSGTRRGLASFENVPVDGSENIADDLMESIETFDFSDAVPFRTEYLSGFFANRYDLGSDAAAKRAAERMTESAVSALRDSVTGYDSVTQNSGSAVMRNMRVKYALYPVWILNTTWRGQKYMFAMNGQTGKFVGNLPMDSLSYWKYRILYGLGFAAALCAGMYALQLF